MRFHPSARALLNRMRRRELGNKYRPALEQLETRLVPSLFFPGGFAGAGGVLTTNGSASISGSMLQLTDGKQGEAGSAFSMFQQNIATFTTDFTFRLSNAEADGFTFAIQGTAATALGPTGGGLGYGPDVAGGTGGIAKSVAIKFDLFDNQGEGNDSTGLYTNGAAPTNAASHDLSDTGINLHNGHVFDVAMAYDGTTLKVTITDTATTASATQMYTVNILSIVGGNTAFVGFTGGTGGLTATQDILSWTYTTPLDVPPAPRNVTATASRGLVSISWTASPGATSYNIYRSTTSGAETLFKSGVSGTSFADSAVTSGTTYFYEVTGVSLGGESLKSTEASAKEDGNQQGLLFPGGFDGAGSLLTTNGSASITGSMLRLTDGKEGEAGSAFSTAQQNIATFSTDFKFRLSDAEADGFAFVIQSTAATALGLTGGGLGYGPDEAGGKSGIAKSVAIKFDLFDNQGEGNNSTGLYINGAAPTDAGSQDLSGTGINLHSDHVFDVFMAYDGATLKVTITDTATTASATQMYTVNIPSIVGTPPPTPDGPASSAAFVGFTGGTGGMTATQDILSWTYATPLTAPPAPTNVFAFPSSASISVSWTASQGASSYNIYRSTTSGTETLLKSGVVGTSFADTAVTSGTTYFYEVTAVGLGGESAKSTEASAHADGIEGLQFPGGFAGAGSLLTTNGSASISGSMLRLTDGKEGEAGSAFSTAQQNITNFITDFKFRLTDADADGLTFAIQGTGATSLGATGGGLGYGPDEAGGTGGIGKSVAIKFDLFDNQGEGNDSTGLYINGAAPTNAGSQDLTGTGINLHNGDVFAVHLDYDGTTLRVTITDTATTASATQSYTVNIPSIVGGSTAFVGFTGGTGGLSATQDILSWTFGMGRIVPLVTPT
jgi:hypothetical protein